MSGTEPPRPKPLRSARGLPLRSPGRAFLLIFALSFSIQCVYLTLVPEESIRPNTLWEFPSIAVALAERGQFADPYALPTGPTAHLPPIPPAIFGLFYRLFGLSLLGGVVGWLVTVALNSALWGMLPWVAGRIGLGGGAGILAGLVGGVLPHGPGHGEGLAALSLALLMVGFLGRWEKGHSTSAGSTLLGIGAGIAFHIQPALLPVVLGWMAFEIWWRKGSRRWSHTGLVAVGMILACLPWAWRNHRAFDAVFFVRSNFGLELRMGNHEGAAASFNAMDRRGEEYVHPRALESEARKVREMGEVPYMRAAGREAVDWIRNNPGPFVELTAYRFVLWWLGPLYDPLRAFPFLGLTLLAVLGAWLTFPAISVPGRAALLVPLLTFPLVHHVVAYMPRYREPIDWIFLLLAGAAVWRVAGFKRGSEDGPGLAPEGH
jgi:MFS family permease